MSSNVSFGILGVGGYIAQRHVDSICSLGHKVEFACDPHDQVGFLDRYGQNIKFTKHIEEFEWWLSTNPPQGKRYLSVCTPNFLHPYHCMLGLRNEMDVICEKPLVIDRANFAMLEEQTHKYHNRISVVHQLRVHPEVIRLRKMLESSNGNERKQVRLIYITSRGNWYARSWKGNSELSGGVLFNIGVHLFDLLSHLFGPEERTELVFKSDRSVGGRSVLANADVDWFLSLEPEDLPPSTLETGAKTYRSLIIEGDEFDLSNGFTDLHTRVYETIIEGGGVSLDEVRDPLEWIWKVKDLPTPRYEKSEFRDSFMNMGAQ